MQWRSKKAASAQSAKKAKPGAKHRDAAVRTVAYDDEVSGPSFGVQPTGGASMRSIVVPRDGNGYNTAEPIHSAQLQAPQQNPDNRYGDQIRTPFGDEPAPGSAEMQHEMERDFDQTPPQPPDELRSPGINDLSPPINDLTEPNTQQRQPGGQQPRTFQPQPPAQAPRPGYDPFGTEKKPSAQANELPSVEPGVLAEEQSKSEENCKQELAKIKGRAISDVDLNIVISGTQGEDYPFECSIEDGSVFGGRCWCESTYMWKASALCHKPLYFEDEGLERYGHSWGPCCDPLISGAHFFGTLPVLPYCMGVTPPTECMYALGHYRPGSCAPYMINPVPVSCRGAAFQAGAVVGAAAIIP